ncbi:PREDICTED: WAP four-disulfide core domain protein 10A [Elephantulus edwardii]|uniref:WAP four-disulfide core domain protein 10A n=1 Tax=Elephantulus edwardii TaxID=28737 RepID=UPI0003F0AEAC|nr:PREDICTED: WAP four-disulfide core domain protein 10A [Elephantulus edwardii]
MARQTLLPILLLCMVLPQSQEGPRRRHKHSPKPKDTMEVQTCEKRPSIYLCSRLCVNHKECQANNICCSTFCGNICMSVL